VERIWTLCKRIRAASSDAAIERVVLSALGVLSFLPPPERRAHRQLNSLLSERRKLSTGNRHLARFPSRRGPRGPRPSQSRTCATDACGSS
jgi:hypothetical protein